MAKARASGVVPSRVATLKKRSEYLRVRNGLRCATAAFVLEAKVRSADADNPAAEPRFGYTITKRVGKAVERNRIRRRLKSAVRGIASQHARGAFDYVVIARRPALTSPFAALIGDLVRALARLHQAPARMR